MEYFFAGRTGNFTDKEEKEINLLLKQLNTEIKPVGKQELENICRNSLLLVKDAGKIIGMGTLCIFDTMSDRKGQIEDVVVDAKYRGRGIGKKIVLRLIQEAKNRQCKLVDLTSNPSRKTANKLYQRLNFKIRETNSYRKLLFDDLD